MTAPIEHTVDVTPPQDRDDFEPEADQATAEELAARDAVIAAGEGGRVEQAGVDDQDQDRNDG